MLCRADGLQRGSSTPWSSSGLCALGIFPGLESIEMNLPGAGDTASPWEGTSLHLAPLHFGIPSLLSFLISPRREMPRSSAARVRLS